MRANQSWTDSYLSLCPKQLWERACSRRRFNIQLIRRVLYRFREQARSHMGIALRLRDRSSSVDHNGA
ncbi:hypothetical protein F7R05_01925 [Pseudomonas koreensis]|nr:hypothetical protein F7R05_01925 [Pseudomonas koreensis]